MSSETNYAVAPGEYLAEWLDENTMTQKEAADRLGCSRKLVNEIVNGRAPVTAETAVRLERLTGIPTNSWLRFEAAYRGDLARIEEQESLAVHASKIPAGTAKFLRGIGATTATMRTPGRLVSDFLSFHRCGTWAAFEDQVSGSMQGDFALAALKEQKSEFDPIACSTWLRAGELSDAYEQGRTFTYNPERLMNLLPDLRVRAAAPDARLLGDLADLLAQAGVVFTMVEPPASMPLYGVTHWIDRRVPVVQQTGRRGKDGFIIWTFFHELGHVLNDPRGETHFEYKSERVRNTVAEKSANAFAMNVLFGSDGMEPFQGLTRDREIAETARQVGVSPGVAVHQLHRKRMLDYSWGNQLLVDIER